MIKLLYDALKPLIAKSKDAKRENVKGPFDTIYAIRTNLIACEASIGLINPIQDPLPFAQKLLAFQDLLSACGKNTSVLLVMPMVKKSVDFPTRENISLAKLANSLMSEHNRLYKDISKQIKILVDESKILAGVVNSDNYNSLIRAGNSMAISGAVQNLSFSLYAIEEVWNKYHPIEKCLLKASECTSGKVERMTATN